MFFVLWRREDWDLIHQQPVRAEVAHGFPFTGTAWGVQNGSSYNTIFYCQLCLD
jgi:hypothetical protein